MKKPTAYNLKSYVVLYLTEYHKELEKAKKYISFLENTINEYETSCLHGRYFDCCEKCHDAICDHCEIICYDCDQRICSYCSEHSRECLECKESVYSCCNGCWDYKGRGIFCEICEDWYHTECFGGITEHTECFWETTEEDINVCQNCFSECQICGGMRWEPIECHICNIEICESCEVYHDESCESWEGDQGNWWCWDCGKLFVENNIQYYECGLENEEFCLCNIAEHWICNTCGISDSYGDVIEECDFCLNKICKEHIVECNICDYKICKDCNDDGKGCKWFFD